MRQWHCGNAFAQAQHDGGSRHSVKYQVLAMQGVPPGLDKNLVLLLYLLGETEMFSPFTR